MAKKSRLTRAAVSIGTAVGTAERKAREAQKAAVELRKRIKQLGKDLKKARKELQRAVARARG